MKKLIWLIMVACFVPTTGWAAPITVSFDPSSSVIGGVGDIFTVDIVADIPDPVLGWGLDVSFDTGVLDLTGVAIDPLWFPGFAPDGDGLAGLAFPSPIFGSDIVLATLTFEAIAVGLSDLVASVTPLDFTEGFPLAPPALPGSFAPITFVDGSVNVVPEPGTFWLLGTSLVMFLGYAWRKRKKAA